MGERSDFTYIDMIHIFDLSSTIIFYNCVYFDFAMLLPIRCVSEI